jgi:protocatechuate 3,4-dioxygenase beta subunit
MSSRNSRWLAPVLALTAAAAVSAQPQPQQPAPATANASVSGVVTNSVTRAPLPRAHVMLMVFGNSGTRVLNTVTDAEGKFTFSGLPAGRFMLNVDRVGFVPPAAGNRMPNSQLRADDKIEDLKLSLTPTGGISGRVLDAGGAPVQGAIVSLDGAPFGFNPTTSDEKGQFRISGVPPGRYRVAANPAVMPFPAEIRTDGTREVHYARTYYPDALTAKAGQRVEVGPSAEVMGIDIRLASTPVVTLSGRVLDLPAGGKTVVRAVASAATGGGVQMANNVRPDGSFQIWQLDPGKYTVIATNTGQQRSLQSTPVEIEVAGLDIEHVELRMIQPFDVTAQLAFDDAAAREIPAMPARQGPGQPPNAQGAPRQPARRGLMVRPEAPAFASLGPSIFQPVEIAADDSFTLEKLQPGRYRVIPTWGVYVKSVSVGNTDAAGDILDLRNGPAGAVKVTVGSVTGEVSGVVSDANGPAAGARVVMFADPVPGRNPMYGMADADGAYKFASVPPGTYKLIAGDNDIVMQFQPGRETDEYADVAESIEVHPGDKLTRALKKQAAR